MAAINQKTAMALLRKARDEKGADYVDPNSKAGFGDNCRYFNRSHRGVTPGCIVGHVLDYANERRFGPRAEVNNDGIDALVRKYDDLFTEGAVKVLAAAQRVQDEGKTWGEAVAAANKVAH